MAGISLRTWMPSRAMVAQAVPLLLMAISVFFFLAPGYQKTAIIFCIATLIVQWLRTPAIARWQRYWFATFLVPSSIYATSVLLAPAVTATHLRELAVGTLACATALTMVRGDDVLPRRYAFYFLALPLVMHLGFFLTVIPQHLFGSAAGTWIEKCETLRTVAQIGPKLLGQVLALLIPISYYAMYYGENRREQWLARALFCVACLCLALLDSRAAYLCLAFGLVLAAITRHRMAHWQHSNAASAETARRLCRFRQFVIAVSLLCVALAAVVGWHRFKSFNESVRTAWHNEQQTAWITPETWVSEFCHDTKKECVVDNSMYLRLSWIKFGITVIAQHPLGMVPSLRPLEKTLSIYYPQIAAHHPVYDSFHSSLVDVGVNYGIPGMALVLALLLLPLRVLLRKAGSDGAPNYLPMLACLWGIWMSRSIVDGLGDSLWFSAWAYGGFVLALLRDRRQLLR